ncbi:MAG: DEAD/DEAH box helicase family protein, partial [Nitrososphaerota archaeon]
MQLYDAQLIYNNLVNNFEFAEIRDTQKKLLKFLAKSLVDKKFIFIEAPPGTGKTAVAVALAKSFKNAYYLCSTKSLQDQLKSDYTDCIKYIKGRSNYECIIHTYSKDQFLTIKKNEYTDSSAYKSIDKYYEPYKSLIADQSCASCFCKFVGCNKCNYCPYLISKSEALSHPITCANYSWYFYYKLYSDKTIAKNLIICDEAHNVINSLIGLSEWRLSQKICDAHSYNFKLSDYDLSNISELDLMYLLNSKFKRILGQRISLL